MNETRVADYLRQGELYAHTARELAYMMNCNVRDISKMIEEERRQGAPICATCDNRRPGYYLADNPADLAAYCQKLHRRAGEIYKTRRALLKTMQQMQEEQTTHTTHTAQEVHA